MNTKRSASQGKASAGPGVTFSTGETIRVAAFTFDKRESTGNRVGNEEDESVMAPLLLRKKLGLEKGNIGWSLY